MSFSSEFKQNVNSLIQRERVVVLLQVTHPFLSSPVRVVDDNKDFIFQGENYLALPFVLKRQDDVKGELPKITLKLPNAGRALVKWIDSSGGGRGAKVRIMLARRSAPDRIEEAINLDIDSVSITQTEVNFNLIVQNNLAKKSMRFTYDKKRAPSLF